MKKFLIAAAVLFSAALNAQTVQKLVSTKDASISNRMFFDGAWRYKWMSNSVVKGGVVTWVSGLTFAVTSATYTINGQEYSSASGQISLNASDPSNPRFDVVALNTAGQIIKITGTPSAIPAIPQVNQSTQVYLTSILVPAGATTPGGVSSVTVYDENTEWSHTQADFPAGISFASSTSPYSGSVGINVTGSTTPATAASGAIKFFNGTTTYNYYDFSVLRFYIKLKAALPSTAMLQVAIGNGNEQMTAISSAHGFNPSLVGSWQNISIPMSDIAKLSTTFSALYISITGTNIGYYIDNIQLQSGIGGSLGAGYLTDWFIKAGTDSAFVVINGVPEFRNRIISGGGASFYDVNGTMSSDRNVTGNNKNLSFNNTRFFTLDTKYGIILSSDSAGLGKANIVCRALPSIAGYVQLAAWNSLRDTVSLIQVFKDSVYFNAANGKYVFENLKSSNTANDSMLIFNPTTKKIFYRAIPTGSGGAPLNSPAFTGVPTAPTPATGTNTTQLATTAFVKNQIQQTQTDSALSVTSPVASGVPLFNAVSSTNLQIKKLRAGTNITLTPNADSTITIDATGSGGAPLNSPAFTGVPTAPTPATGTNTTQIATAAMVQNQLQQTLNDSAIDVVRPVTNGTVKMFEKISTTKLQIKDLKSSTDINVIQNNDSTVSFFTTATAQTITTGTTTTVSNNIKVVYIDPASLLASHTITMPAVPTDQQVIIFVSGGTIAAGSTVVTSLTFAPNTGQTIYQSITPTTAKGGDTFKYMYNLASTRWIRL